MGNIIKSNITGINIKIGEFNIIEEDVIIGKNVTIGNYVYIARGTVIGNGCFLDSYVKSSGDNQIGDGVTLRYNATVAKHCTIGRNTYISPNVMTIYTEPDGSVLGDINIGSDCFIGTNCVIGSGVTICNKVTVGAMAYVNKDILEEGTYVGIPARRLEK
jgi:UDP-2-acetamido-3-amino-2,3-dideoxy-glucuronate N-acetyltransferase